MSPDSICSYEMTCLYCTLGILTWYMQQELIFLLPAWKPEDRQLKCFPVVRTTLSQPAMPIWPDSKAFHGVSLKLIHVDLHQAQTLQTSDAWRGTETQTRLALIPPDSESKSAKNGPSAPSLSYNSSRKQAPNISAKEHK